MTWQRLKNGPRSLGEGGYFVCRRNHPISPFDFFPLFFVGGELVDTVFKQGGCFSHLAL